MRFSRVSIASMGTVLPPSVLSSTAIEDALAPVYQRIGLVPGRLELMTGVKERRYWPDGMRPSEASTQAGLRALAAAPQLERARIGALVHASVCRDFLEPATACLVHHALGLSPEAQIFDLSNACLGVANAMLVVGTMIEAGQIEAGLVVSGENGKPLLDSTIAALNADPALTRKSIKSAIPSLTIGSGAAAVLLCKSELAPQAPRLLGGVARAATEHHRLCEGDTAGQGMLMSTDAEALLNAGIALAKEAWPRFLAELEFPAQPKRVITHQVGRAHTQALFAALGLELGATQLSYDRLGNVGSASLPITLAQAAESGFITRGDEVALLGIGSGLSTVFLGVRW